MRYRKNITYRLKREIRFPDFTNGGVTIFKKGEAFIYQTPTDNEFHISCFRADDGVVFAVDVLKKVEKDYGGKLMLSPKEWSELKSQNNSITE